MNSSVNIIGPGAELLTIEANEASRVFSINAGVQTTISGLTITGGGNVDSGGGVKNLGNLILDSVVVSGNHTILNSVSTNVGGGVYSLGGSLRVIDSTIVGNQGRYGGGLNVSLANDSVLEIKGSTIANNYGLNTPAQGSAANGIGGGLLLGASPGWTGTASILNSTFSGNRSERGAGLSIHGAAASATIVNSTIAYNQTADAAGATISGGYAGGIQNYLGSATLHNTIVAQNEANNTSFHDVWGSLSGSGTSSHNLIGQTASSGLTNGSPLNNQVGGVSGGPRLDPKLSPTLTDNGGSTKTHALLPTSSAIDAGSAARATAFGLTHDQRCPVFKRQVIGGVDIGAVEAYVAQSTPTSAIVIHGTDGADGITIGLSVAGQTVVALDSTGGVEMPVSLASAASVTVYANGGDDAVSVQTDLTKPITIYGGDGDDLLVGGAANDVFYGGLGADSIHGGAGADTLYAYLNAGAQIGGDGADSLFGDAGADQLYVEFGSDKYEADSGEVSGQNAPAPAASNWNTFIKNENTGFGAGWDLAPLDRLLFNADPNQPNMIRWVGTDGYFNDFAGYGVKSATDQSASVLSDATGSVPFYVRRDKFGNTSYYSTATGNEGVLLKSADRLGVGYQYVYGDHDGDGKSLEIESVTRIRPGQLGETTVYHYDGSRIDTVTDVFGRVTNLYYSSGQLQQIVLPAPNSSQPNARPTFSFTYDWRGLVSSITDADQRVTTFSFDHGATGELTITYPDGGVRKLLPARDDFYDDWRSQLGSWGAMLPTFKYKSELDQPGNKYGYQIDELNRTSTYTINGQGHVVETKDAAGQVTLTTRNSAGLPTQVTVKSAGGATVQVTGYQYDANHNLTRIDYFDGTYETWAYDPTFSQRTEHFDQLSRMTLNTVDPATGNTMEARTIVGQDDRQSTERDDVITQYQYEADGLVKSIVQLRSDVNGTAQLSFAETYAYTSVTAGGVGHIGRWWQSNSYGGDNSAISGVTLINPATVSVIARNAHGMPTTVRDDVNRDTQYAYDNLDRLTKVTLPNPGDGQFQPVIEYAYTLSGLLQDETRTRVGAIAAERITTHMTFDANGRVQNVYEDYGGADQALTVYTYDAAGHVTQTTDARNQQTRFTYDALGRLIASRNPVGQLTRGEFDRVGRLVKYIAPLGAVTAMAYDAAGQQTSQIGPEGRASSYHYDDAGRIVAARALGHVQPAIYKYDSASNLRFRSDPLTNTAEYLYDARGRLLQERDENGKSVNYGYTNANELQTLTDPNLNETAWIYDGAGRVKSETNELGHARTYKYDAYNRLAEKTDRNGRTTKYEYDRLDYLAAEKWYVGAVFQRTITYDFDKVGNLELVSDPSATYDYEYDGLSRQTAVTQTIAGLTPTVRFDDAYDAAGRRTSSAAKIGGAADYVNAYSYDALGRLAKLTQASQVVTGAHQVAYKRVELGYNQASELTSVSRFSSSSQPSSLLTSAYSYDAAGRIEQIAHGSNVTHSYAWNDADRLTSYANSIDGSVAYGYDDRGQIIAADYTGAWTQWLTDEAYDYDDNGNRQLANGDSYATIGNNRLQSDGTYHYQYDNEGNRTVRFVDNDANGQLSDGDGDVTFYSWDHRNRLVAIVSYLGEGGHGGHVITLSADYAYDPLNQQIKRVADPDGYDEANLEQTFFLYEDGQIVLQFDKTGAGSAVAADLSHRYLWGATVDQLFADEEVNSLTSAAANVPRWALADHLGTVRDLANNAGAVVDHRVYDSFGNVVHDSDAAIDELFGYTGRPLDEATGLQNNLNRWYDAAVGRWISEDPIGFWAGDANLNRYVGNEVTGWIDPSGLAEGGWYKTRGFGRGLAQGGANLLNSGTEFIIGAGNLLPGAYNYTAGWFLPNAPYIPNPDWSRGLITDEGDIDGDGSGTHSWSKGGGTVAILAGGGALSLARAAALPSRAGFHTGLREVGFEYHSTTRGGWVQYRRADGSKIWIRPNGEVVRLGPKVSPTGGGRSYHPRINESGNPINTHNPGEFTAPLPGH